MKRSIENDGSSSKPSRLQRKDPALSPAFFDFNAVAVVNRFIEVFNFPATSQSKDLSMRETLDNGVSIVSLSSTKPKLLIEGIGALLSSFRGVQSKRAAAPIRRLFAEHVVDSSEIGGAVNIKLEGKGGGNHPNNGFAGGVNKVVEDDDIESERGCVELNIKNNISSFCLDFYRPGEVCQIPFSQA
jgi:hypothetical protein